ncbi:hypothetical protein F0L74_19490 [Chitinophaga agrisoli]|uniref:ATP-grasp domain-containing protein n=1 Tax=Chitinophaga agrisoli TaxID=2607653 RepID=A0A5B2VIP3_9BACT|nr:STM4014 family protein [Chitinophaga agrisoli]KAA2238416.1 hypothetical protein F0L74_19490 [Chitinophaga agrisoli]
MKTDAVIIGNPENRRTAFFCEAAAKLLNGTITIVPYIDLLTHINTILPGITPGSIVKIDSPGENTAVRKLLIERGLGAAADEPYEKGPIIHLQAWYKGYCGLLDRIRQQLPDTAHVMNTVQDIKLMFDKPACQQHLYNNKVPVPRILPPVDNYDELVLVMQQQRIMRVFVKPAHASSASGVVAFRRNGRQVQAVSSAALHHTPDGPRLYNSLKVQTYNRETDIAALMNIILSENAQVEEWLPKAIIHDRYFDIRVLAIAGKARHMVLRTSKQVITNLHLGNKRGNMQDLIAIFGAQKLTEIQQLAEQTAACFPNSLYMGIDILLTNTANVFVLEVNAFGDLLPGLVHNDENCYEASLSAALQQKEARAIC